MILYMDMNVYYRVFDDQSQPRINNETKSIEIILKVIERWNYKLCWSYILERENMANPSQDMRKEVKTIADMLCNVYIKWEKEIDIIARTIIKNSNAKPLDALHLACAVYGKCDYFITCDDKFIKTIKNNKEKFKNIIGSVKIINPLDFIQKRVIKNMLPDIELTDNEIIEKGNKAIIKELGVSGYIRYLRLQRPNNEGRNYLEIREETFKDMNIDEVIEWAKQI